MYMNTLPDLKKTLEVFTAAFIKGNNYDVCSTPSGVGISINLILLYTTGCIDTAIIIFIYLQAPRPYGCSV